VRMQHTLLGEEKFQAGMKLYFKRHDGQAVTCDDFVQAMQDASGVDLAQFRRWYDVAGTPTVQCSSTFEDGVFELRVKQSMNPPFHIQLAVKVGDKEQMLHVRKADETFSFPGLKSKPVPSLLRRFSAPVVLNYPYSEAELLHLLAHDDDPFNRWEAGQRLATTIILDKKGEPSAAFVEAMGRMLQEKDTIFAAEVLNLPPESFLAEQLEVVDPDALHDSRNRLRKVLATKLEVPFRAAYDRLKVQGRYSPDPVSIGARSLRNACLGYLAELGDSALVYEQFRAADNMTDSMAALTWLAQLDCPERDSALEAFYKKWSDEPLVVDKWLMVQASSRLPRTLSVVKGLLKHPAFDIKVPNKVYALIRAFCANHVRFHAADGSGYAFLADQVIALNGFNPQVGARMARGFDRWTKFDASRKAKARMQLERIRDADGLSKDVAEIVTKALAG